MTDLASSTYGGLLMFLTGILYLLFEDAIIGHSSTKNNGSINSLGSRTIMGMQVCDSSRVPGNEVY